MPLIQMHINLMEPMAILKLIAAVNHPTEFTIELWARLTKQQHFQSPQSSRYGSAPWNNLSGYNFYAVNGLEKWSFTAGSGGAWRN